MKRPNLLFTLFFIITHGASFSQNYTYAYYFDENFNATAKQHAAIKGRGYKTEKGVTVDFYSIKENIKFNSTEYTDSTLAIMNGLNILYKNGQKEIEENYKMNVLDGLTQKWDTAGRLIDSTIFVNGKATYRSNNSYIPNGNLVQSTITDSIHNTLLVTTYDTANLLLSTVSFKGDKGIMTYYNPDGTIKNSDSLFTREEKDASYPGGPQAWLRFLELNLRLDLLTKNGAQGIAKVVIRFIIDKDGSIHDIKPLTKIGFGVEEEAVRVLRKSGKWIPAMQYGKPVKAYRKQPFTFQIF